MKEPSSPLRPWALSSPAMGLPLHAACERGDTERVRQLLGDGALIDEKGWRLGTRGGRWLRYHRMLLLLLLLWWCSRTRR